MAYRRSSSGCRSNVTLHRETDIARSASTHTCTLLNAVHLDNLFRRACDHFADSGHKRFDMLRASRLHRPVAASVSTCLADILARVKTVADLELFAAPFIAECLILDNYAYDVHGLFSLPLWKAKF